MILDNLFPELTGLGNASNKLSVSDFDNLCLNIYVLCSLCLSNCFDVFDINIRVLTVCRIEAEYNSSLVALKCLIS